MSPEQSGLTLLAWIVLRSHFMMYQYLTGSADPMAGTVRSCWDIAGFHCGVRSPGEPIERVITQ
jgi:hypothetical protein